ATICSRRRTSTRRSRSPPRFPVRRREASRSGRSWRSPDRLSQVDDASTTRAREAVDRVYRTESRRVLATLIRLLGDFDLAEEALQEAFAAAVERWPAEGMPSNPRAWLVSTGRFKAIDQLRRRARFDASLVSVAERLG